MSVAKLGATAMFQLCLWTKPLAGQLPVQLEFTMTANVVRASLLIPDPVVLTVLLRSIVSACPGYADEAAGERFVAVFRGPSGRLRCR